MQGAAEPWFRDSASLRFLASRFVPWFFGLNLLWELAHARFYTVWTEGSGRWIAFSLLHCTLGDVLIGLASLALALLVVRAGPLRDWPVRALAALTTAFGAAYTVFSEWMNIRLLRSWAYAESMPTLPLGGFDLGVTPLLQWLVLPALALVLSRPGGTMR